MCKSTPDISIIIPAYNCEKTIQKCLESLIVQNYPSYEIIIVDDGSTDSTANICAGYETVKLIQTTNGGPSRARNIGVKAAKGDIVAFTDSDCIIHHDWIKELQKGFSSDDVVSVGGNQISPTDETPFGKCVQDTFSMLGFATSYMKTHTTLTVTSHNPSCNSSYRKSVFEKIGGFDQSLWPGEDVDLDHRLNRLGFTLIRNTKAIVQHYRPQTLSELSKMMKRYGGSAYHLLKRFGFFRPLHYMPFLTITVLLIFVITLCFSPIALIYFFIALTGVFLILVSHKNLLSNAAIVALLSSVILINWHLGFFKQAFWPVKKWATSS